MSEPSRMLWSAVHAARGWVGVLLLTALADSGTRLLLPLVVGGAVDAVLGAGETWPALAVVVAVVVAATCLEGLRGVADARSEAGCVQALRTALVDHVLGPGTVDPGRFRGGDLVARVLQSAAEAGRFAPALVAMVGSALTSVGGLVALFAIDVRLGLIFILAAPPMWWLMRWLIRRVAATTEEYQRWNADLAGRFIDAASGVRTIRACATTEREIDRVLAPLPHLQRAGTEFWAIMVRAGWQLGTVQPLVRVAVLGAAGVGVVQGRVSAGELLAAIGYVGLALGLLRQSAGFAGVARAYGSARRVAEVVARPVRRPGCATLPPGPGELRLRGVRVERGGQSVLREVDLAVPARATVAVVGTSGAGKSTLLEAAGGLRGPDAGTVSLDGIPLGEIDPRELRSAVAYAFERPALLGHTVADAVGYGHPSPAPADVRRALRLVRAETFVDRLPDGADTPLPTVRLSGGEVQRLGLARAACREARLLLLDDATSSLDTATEAEISAALADLARDTTCLVVTHRATTAARCDLVLWLSEGRVQAFAPHAELQQHPGYRRLFAPSTSGVSDLPVRVP